MNIKYLLHLLSHTLADVSLQQVPNLPFNMRNTPECELGLSRQCWLTIHVVFEGWSFNNGVIIQVCV